MFLLCSMFVVMANNALETKHVGYKSVKSPDRKLGKLGCRRPIIESNIT